mmetsp:Transcript_54570/g.125298  ORF Transcript_54570/g.125298 Transcript_54570/m.125298 type:complete len:111 (+) Transcript_54570:786-1118(+)
MPEVHWQSSNQIACLLQMFWIHKLWAWRESDATIKSLLQARLTRCCGLSNLACLSSVQVMRVDFGGPLHSLVVCGKELQEHELECLARHAAHLQPQDVACDEKDDTRLLT